jgi:predicted NBD/HSP70 family sugar kinase
MYEVTTHNFDERNTNPVAVRLEGVGQRSETVRRSNLSAILLELHGGGAVSRSALVARTGLTRSAIRGLIAEFVAAGLVTEERAEPLGGPGRPSPLVRPNPRRAVVLALEIAVDSLAAAVVGLGGVVLEIARVERPRGHLDAEDIAADLAELAGRVREGRPPDELFVATGVAVVGVVRRSDGFVSMAPNLGWRDLPLREPLAAALRGVIPADTPINIANEADLGALAELRRGAARGVDDVIFISGEVGVGGGIIVGGIPLTGAAGYGGELGHITVNPIGLGCRCGSLGCWETEVGEEALLRRAGLPASMGRSGVDQVLRDADAGSGVALKALDEVGRWLGIGLAGLVNLFNPRLVVLGGSFGRIHPFISSRLERELDRRSLPGSRDLVRVVPARLGLDAPLLGAAELAFEPLLADPAAWLGPREPVLAYAGA